MIVFLDSSAWIKFFIEEEGTSEIQNFVIEKSISEENTFSTSAVTYAEIYATFKRALNSERITEDEYNQIKNEFEEQWDNVDIPFVNTILISNSG
ncbi:MAG: PIN domain-containing protein, partial [Nitrosopumilaceae archaeon]|nr:type II toxin-antitoxin system VapC family toxin [Nitrosopumilaceae archaeon]NIX62058.1 PIN domain-containing protein [Nitrosopumilaceae archaeon]